MKKIKKSLAVVLCLIMTSVILSACTSSNGSTGEDPKPTTTVEDPKPTEEVVTTTPEVEPTEEPTTVEEPTEVSEEDVIIELNCFTYDFNNSDPMDLLLYENVAYMYMLEDANVEAGGTELYRIVDPDTTNLTIHGYPDATEEHSVDGVFFTNVDSYTGVYFLVDGEYLSMPSFIPFFYNETKGCIVGLSISTEYAEPRDALFELRYLSDFDQLALYPVEDPSIYGF